MSTESNKYDDVARLTARLTNLRTADGYTLGAEAADGRILNVPATAQALGLPAPRDLDDLLQNGTGAQIIAVLDEVARRPEAAVNIAVSEADFAPLVTRPEKIICIGFNYKEHAKETGTPVPKEPPLFAKFANALNHHQGTVKLPTDVDSHFDYETELVIVFGRACRNVKEDDALDYVAGYAVGNDLSARKLQAATTQFTAGKISDGFAPVGPWLVPRDKVPNPNGLQLQTQFNGEMRQDWTTGDMIFNCKQLIAFCAGILTLKPGDLLFTGTPQGVIFGEKKPAFMRHWIKPGDEVVSRIETLGELRVQFT